MNHSLLVLQARAARELGIPWGVFDSLTPAELAAIAEDHKESWIAEQKVRDARVARMTAAIYRAAGAKVKESEFMPSYEPPQPMKQEDLIDRIDHIFRGMQAMSNGS